MVPVSAMHEQMQERTGKQQQKKARSHDVGTMLREEQESADHQQDKKTEAHSRRQEPAFWFRLPVSVVVVRHAILSSATRRIVRSIIQSEKYKYHRSIQEYDLG